MSESDTAVICSSIFLRAAFGVAEVRVRSHGRGDSFFCSWSMDLCIIWLILASLLLVEAEIMMI